MKHASFFPFLVLALTLILVTGFVFFSSPPAYRQAQKEIQTPSVTVEQYQTALAIVVKKFMSDYGSAGENALRAKIVEETLNTLLSMRVPAEEKDLHLELAIALQKMKQGLNANPQDVTDGYAQIQTIISQTSWLHL